MKMTRHQIPLILLLLAGLQFYVGLMEPMLDGVGLAGMARVIRHGHLAPLGLAFLSVLVIPGALSHMGRMVRLWLLWVIVFMVLMTLVGIFRGAFANALLLDAGVYEAFVVSVVVGSRKENWKWLDRYFRWLFYLGAVLMLAELLVIERAVREEVISSEAYRMRTVLFAWPFLLFTIALVKKRHQLATLAGVALIVFMYVVFQKRAPTIRMAVALLLFITLLPGIRLRHRLTLRMGVSLVALLCWIGATVLMNNRPETGSIMSESTSALASRFQGSGGLIETITSQNERLKEALFFFNQASPLEIIVGKGFGGAVEVPWTWGPGLEVKEAGRTYYGIYSMHIGITHPLLKGGLIFLLFFFGGWVVLLIRYRRYRDDTRAQACWAVVLLNLLFMTVETLWGPASVVMVILIGVCMGYMCRSTFGDKRPVIKEQQT
jgi:hypothetical protein